MDGSALDLVHPEGEGTRDSSITTATNSCKCTQPDFIYQFNVILQQSPCVYSDTRRTPLTLYKFNAKNTNNTISHHINLSLKCVNNNENYHSIITQNTLLKLFN